MPAVEAVEKLKTVIGVLSAFKTTYFEYRCALLTWMAKSPIIYIPTETCTLCRVIKYIFLLRHGLHVGSSNIYLLKHGLHVGSSNGVQMLIGHKCILTVLGLRSSRGWERCGYIAAGPCILPYDSELGSS
jgi:hypothetical protein